MAAMSVIGIDFGNESCYIAAARAGGIETLANDYSLRATPSCVAFSSKNRILGVAAKNQLVTNMKNTVHGFKRLLGRKYDDPIVQRELQHLPYAVEKGHGGDICIKVQYHNQEQVFSPEQITAMLFTKLKEIAETALQTKVNDCVISVPAFFTNVERQALLDSANIAGLNVLRLMNETLATALAYGIYKQDLPEPDAKPRNVVFVDWGHSALQVSACAFHKGKLKMLSSAGDANLGGRDIDAILAEQFNNHFRSQYRVDAKTNARAMVRLLTEVEKIKKQMSANSTTLPLAIECFMDDKDVRAEMKRTDMESLCSHLFEKAEKVMRKCLEDSKLRVDDIHSVEIVGGSSRVPALKNLIAHIFGHQPSTTLNQDEAVSRGCALQCALLSPAVRVRDFLASDVQAYPIKLVWDPAMGEDDAPRGCFREMEVFPKNHVVPFSKMLTFYRTGPFALRALYSGEIPHPDPKIGEFTVKDVKPAPTGESQKVKVKVRVNLHGIFKVSSASLVEQAKPGDPGDQKELSGEPMDVENEQQGSPKKSENGPKPDNSGECDMNEDVNEKDKKGSKKKVVCTDLPVECKSYGLSAEDLNGCQELEFKMIADDRQEKERVDARNALEEYVYELRGQLASEEELATYVEERERSSLSNSLDEMENWLYEEGEDCMRQAYVDRLSELKARGEPIKVRRHESLSRGSALEDLSHSLMMARKALEAAEFGDERYNHLTPEELKKVYQAVDKTSQWLEEQRALLARTPRTQNPPVLVSTIRQEKQSFDSLAGSVLNKPKPKVEPPPAATKEDASPKEQANTANQNNTEGSSSFDQNTEGSNGQPTVEMDTD